MTNQYNPVDPVPSPNDNNQSQVVIQGGQAGTGRIQKGSPSSRNTFGVTFPTGVTVKQTLLPIMTAFDRVVGFFPISETTFTGAERTFSLPSSPIPIPITSVALPNKNKTNIFDEDRQELFMVAYWPEGTGDVSTDNNPNHLPWRHDPDSTTKTITTFRDLEPWRGYSEFVDGAKPNGLGFYSWWSMPAVLWMHHFNRGVYLNAMVYNMDSPVVAPPATPNPPVVTPQTIRWACTANKESFLLDCARYDFNWLTKFETDYPLDSNQYGNGRVPMSIEVVSNPPGGFFKAVVVQGVQTIIAGGSAVFDTVRILRLEDPTAGDYTFTFNIKVSLNGSIVTIPATLTMTVV
jgi:hypothetical protein